MVEGESTNQEQILSMEQEEFKLEPLNPEKVEKVVEEYAERHVGHKHGAIIFIGSGGGKSTTCRNQTPNAEGKTDLVDADFLYRETDAHPLKPRSNPNEPLRPLPWWDMGPKVIQDVEKRCGIVNQSIIDHGLWALTTSFDPDDKYIPENIVIVILPWEEHKRRIAEKFQSEHYDAGAQPTEEGFARVLSHREWTEKVAKEKNIPVVDSIEAAVDLIRSREVK
jgi:2-phosphoglycerate kinase